MRLILALSAALALAACGKPAEEASSNAQTDVVQIIKPSSADDPAVAQPAAANAPGSAAVADMIDCAGAFGAVGKIDPTSREQNLEDPWFQEFSGIQLSIMTMPDNPGAECLSTAMMGRVAHWKAQAPAAQLARAEACKTQY